MPPAGRDGNGAGEQAPRDAQGSAAVAKGVSTLASPVAAKGPSTLASPVAAPPAAVSSWVTVAEDSEDRRAFLQERILLFAKTVSIISFSFFCVSAVSFVFLAERAPIHVLGWESCWHLGSIGVLVIMWMLTRWTKLEDRTLSHVDVLGTLLACTAYGLMALRTNDAPGPIIGSGPMPNTYCGRS